MSAPPINTIPLIRADSAVVRELTSFIVCETPLDSDYNIPMSERERTLRVLVVLVHMHNKQYYKAQVQASRIDDIHLQYSTV